MKAGWHPAEYEEGKAGFNPAKHEERKSRIQSGGMEAGRNAPAEVGHTGQGGAKSDSNPLAEKNRSSVAR